jgi:hypothetical protein
LARPCITAKPYHRVGNEAARCKNADSTVDIYFGPKLPAGQESNWLYTQSGQKWFPWFRVYGPEKAIFDKSWKLPDIEMTS